MRKSKLAVLSLVTCLGLQLPSTAMVSVDTNDWLQFDEPQLSSEFLVDVSPLLPAEGLALAKEKQVRYPESLWLASVVPGLGQILMDEPLRGLAFMGGFAVAVPTGWIIGMGLGQLQPGSGTFLRGVNETVIATLVLAGGVYIWNLVDANQLNAEKRELFEEKVSLDTQGNLSWQISSF